jgi:hypothetical protein
MPRRCRSKGERHFIKLPSSDREPEDGGPMSRLWPRRSRQPNIGHLTYNQAPAYIRGLDP